MSESCAIIPKVKNKKGNKVDSRLFKDLLSFTSNKRDIATKAYLITKSNEFSDKFKNKLVLDDNDEPTIYSLLKSTNLKDIISDDDIIKVLNRQINNNKRDALYTNTRDNFNDIVDKAIAFNNNSDFKKEYVANVYKVIKDNKSYLQLRVERRFKDNTSLAKQMEYNKLLNDKLKTILQSKGIEISTITDLEDRLNINGVTDFNTAKATAEGLIKLIRLANNSEGEEALPEEFTHFALEALGDNPLVSRLITNIINNNLAEQIIGDEYDTYSELYNGNELKLAKEAAGKLVADALTNKPTKYQPLITRIINAIKNFFSKFNAKDIQTAINDADKTAKELAKQLMDGSLDDDININNITDTTEYYNLNERVNRDKKILNNIIANELKRLKIYQQRSNSEFEINQANLITDLQDKLKTNNEIEGIYTFIANALEHLEKVNKRLIKIKVNESSNINATAGVLRDIRNYIYSYSSILDTVRDALLDEENESDNRYGERIKIVLNNTELLLKNLKLEYNKAAMPLFIKFLKPFFGNSITIPFGKYKGKVLTVENLVKEADNDISFFDRWLDSMADSSDYLLKIFDQVVKQRKENARLDTIDIKKKLEAATIKLEQSGISNTEFMFERDSEGNLTGNYISEINYGEYNKAVKAMFKRLEDKYGKNPTGKDFLAYNKEKREWFSNNKENVAGVWQPKKSIYGNKKFDELNSAQKEYYDIIMKIKEELDSKIPEHYTKLLHTVKIRKDLIERIKSSKNPKDASLQLWEIIKDEFIKRSDDTMFSDKATIKDFEGYEVQTLPIYYTKLKEGENPNDVSTDIVSTLTAYAAMCNEYDEMSNCINILEVGRSLLRERKIKQAVSDKTLKEKFKLFNTEVESTVSKEGDETYFMQRLNDFFQMQVYNRYLNDEGTFGNTKIQKSKVGNFINKMTALNTFAVNILSGISNVATGTVMMRIESFCKEFFNESNTLIADRNYGKELPSFLAEMGKRVKTNKLALWDELFNVMQEYESDIKEVNFDRKTWVSRMFNSNALYFMNSTGEHWMQNRTSLALADAYKMKSPDGKIVSLWDAMEVVYIDKNNKALGAKLELKKGYTKADGSEFTRKDIIAFSNKTKAINQRMHGIYNYADRNAIQKLALGRMGIMYRKYIKPSLNRRFKSVSYNYDLEAWTEGYYKTTGRFLNQLYKELKEQQFNLSASWKQLHPTEKANIKRALTEVGHFLIIAAILGLVDWDDKRNPWYFKMIEYQTRRLYTEIGSMIPSPAMINEGLKLLDSPAAGINIIQHLTDLIGLINPYNYETFGGEDALLKSGRYKDKSRAYRLWFESPLVPMNKTIYRGLHPEEGIPFYK